MVIKHLENKIRLVGIICTAFLAGCIIISVSSIWTARTLSLIHICKPAFDENRFREELFRELNSSPMSEKRLSDLGWPVSYTHLDVYKRQRYGNEQQSGNRTGHQQKQ